MKSSKQFGRTLLAVAIAAGLAGIGAVAPDAAQAQSADANLRGKAVPGADIVARNVATGATRRTKAGADGSYAMIGLPPGTYAVDAGAGVQRTVTLTVASTATLDLQAAAPQAATNLAGVAVNATTLTEVKTSEIGSTISLEQIRTIPQVSRNFLEFADTVPGMVFSVDPQGHTSLRGGAQNTSSTNVYIDGVGQKSYVKEGGVSGQFNSQGNPFPQLAIGEYKVITSNYKAEYDQISSAAVTAETKSGTNQFHGEVFGTYTDDSLRARTPSENADHDKTPSRSKEYGFAIGGPIIKDKMHFFFTYEAKNFDTPITVVPGAVTNVGTTPGTLLPPSVAQQLGPANLPFTEDLYFGKIDWEPTDRDRFELSGQVRKENQYNNIGTGVAASAGINTINNDTRFSLRWQHSGEAYFNELLFTHEKAYNNPTPLSYGNGSIYTYGPAQDQQILATDAANSLASQKKGQKGPALQETLTLNDLQWHGDHVVKMGVKYKLVDLNAQDAGDNNPQFFYNVGPNGTDALPYKVFFPAPVAGLSPVAKTTDRQFGAFIQDDWAVNDKLTLNLGVRWDYEKNPSFLDYVTPPEVLAALNSQDPRAPAGQTYVQTLAKGGIDINDYIGNGHNRRTSKYQFQPRLGFSYDLNGDEEHVIFGGAGRSYDRDLYDYLQVERTKASLPLYSLYFMDAAGNCHNNSQPCIPWDPKYYGGGLGLLQSLVTASSQGQEIDMIKNNLKTPYSDQFSLGMRNKFGDWNTSATVARILSYDGFAFNLGNRNPNGAFFQPDGSQPWNATVPGYGSLILGSNGIQTRTTQLLLSAEKPYTRESGWGVTFAYTYSHAKQNRDTNEHYSLDEPSIKDYPFITSNAVAKHRFVATGVFDGPWDTVLSLKLTLATPIPGNTVACYSDYLFANGGKCWPTAATPPGTGRFLVGGKFFGYRDIDFQATKNFELGHGVTLYGRFDVLNLFNWKNYSDYLYTSQVVNGAPRTTVVFNPIGNITFVPRTVRLSVGLRF